MPLEPRWNQILTQVASGLRRINSASATGYWNTLRKVLEDMPDQFAQGDLPAIVVSYELSQQSQRVYVGGSRTISDSMLISLEGRFLDDGKGRMSIQRAAFRLCSDIHRALYVEPNLGLSFVKRVTFPHPPEISSGAESGETSVVEFRYSVVVEYSYDDSQP